MLTIQTTQSHKVVPTSDTNHKWSAHAAHNSVQLTTNLGTQESTLITIIGLL